MFRSHFFEIINVYKFCVKKEFLPFHLNQVHLHTSIITDSNVINIAIDLLHISAKFQQNLLKDGCKWT